VRNLRRSMLIVNLSTTDKLHWERFAFSVHCYLADACSALPTKSTSLVQRRVFAALRLRDGLAYFKRSCDKSRNDLLTGERIDGRTGQ
jgi:hypothetical protein